MKGTTLTGKNKGNNNTKEISLISDSNLNRGDADQIPVTIIEIAT